jgi:hypothetical protein
MIGVQDSGAVPRDTAEFFLDFDEAAAYLMQGHLSLTDFFLQEAVK